VADLAQALFFVNLKHFVALGVIQNESTFR
jgi:hypothetical protein